MPDLPDGVITFLFTDVEGSTQLWEQAPDTMMEALRRHDEAIDAASTAYNGVAVKPRGEGDSRFIVFRSAVDAVAASAGIQRRLADVDWPTPRPLRVRTSLHTGVADLQMGDYYGSAVNRAARLRSIAHGGQTVMSGSTWELVRDELPDGVSITDMGTHRLKDLTRPEHVLQIDVEGLDSTFPPLLSLDAIANNLPEQLTEFIGREAELAEAERLLGETRLLTILAPGGAGKTRLAIQAAADMIDEYGDGVFFIALADISLSEEIVQTVAESLGLGLSADEDPLDQLLTSLATKTSLLVFDNFEHVADGAPIVTAILRGAPQVTVVATSRSRLNVGGETVLTLGGLETTWASPEEAMASSGIRLFLDEARRSKPGLVLDTGDLDSVAEILRLTGGLPLGIVLAAAWADMLSIPEIASEMAKNIDFLETDMGDVPDRHRSIRAVFDYTWRLLSADEQGVFASLSVFRGGFTREAAEAVAGASLRSLANLSNKSLVTANPETGRYAVHELLRQFAEEELSDNRDRANEVFEAHARYYSGLAGEAFGMLHRSEQPRMLEILQDDIDNIRVAWHRSLVNGDGALVRPIVTAFWILYEIRGWYRSGLSILGTALDALDKESSDDSVVVARALAAAVQGWILALLGRQDEGALAAAAAIEVLESSEDIEARWLAHHCLGVCLLYQGKFSELDQLALEGLTLADQLDGLFGSAFLMNWRSISHLIPGDLAGAKELLDGMGAVPTDERALLLVLAPDATVTVGQCRRPLAGCRRPVQTVSRESQRHRVPPRHGTSPSTSWARPTQHSGI